MNEDHDATEEPLPAMEHHGRTASRSHGHRGPLLAPVEVSAVATPNEERKMPKFRKKPVVIEAFQMTRERRESNVNWPEWLHRAWNNWPEWLHRAWNTSEESLFIDPDDPDRNRLCIGTLEGVHRIQWDDWIIQGVKGELSVCKPDIFESTYEKVGD